MYFSSCRLIEYLENCQRCTPFDGDDAVNHNEESGTSQSGGIITGEIKNKIAR